MKRKKRTAKVAIQPEMKEMTWAVRLPDGSRWEIVLRRLSGARSVTDVWKNIQVGLVAAYKATVKEWGMIKPKKFTANWKAREITFPTRRKR